jgi:hypothetical protein
MSNGDFLLWGIDGELQGSEHLLQMRLPMFMRDGEEDVVYLARRADWSPDLPEGDVIRIPADRAAEYGDHLDVEETLVEPGQLVVVLGPTLLQNLLAIGVDFTGISATPEAFLAWPKDVAFAEEFAKTIEEIARRRFDHEIGGGIVTDEARSALAVMRNVAVGELRGHLLRSLVLHRLEGNTDQYRRVLRLAQARLQDTAAVIEDEVRHHLEFPRTLSRTNEIGRFRKRFFTGMTSRARTNVIASPRKVTFVSTLRDERTAEIGHVGYVKSEPDSNFKIASIVDGKPLSGVIFKEKSAASGDLTIAKEAFVNPKLLSSLLTEEQEGTRSLVSGRD